MTMATTTAPTTTRDTAITEPSRRAPASGSRIRAGGLIALALLAALFGLTRTWGEPFAHGWLGHNGARYAHMARNYVRDGFFAFGGAPRMDVAAAERGGGESQHSRSFAAPPGRDFAGYGDLPEVYAHHPPATSMAIALAFGLGGVSENVARLLPIVAALAVLLLLARLVALEAGVEAGALAALALAALPMFSIYGAHIDVQGTPVLACSLLVVLAYRRWLAGGAAWPVLATTAAALFFDWYGLYALAACIAHLVVTRRERRGAAVMLGVALLLLFAAMLAWLALLPGSSVGEVLGSAGVRGASALASGPLADGSVGAQLGAWWSQTNALMPLWPAWLLLALLLAAGAVRVASPASDAQPVLGARGLLWLLLLPPLVHAAVFPAGLLVHDYWLFGLPPALAAGFGLAARRVARPVAVGAALLLFVPGWFGAQRVLETEDRLPAAVGQALATATAPGDVVLTNFDCNPFVPGAGDAHLDKFPEVTFYSDRTVRGLVGAGQAGGGTLEEALSRRPDATWFLLTPWPPGPAAGLAESLRERAVEPPRRLSDNPPVELFRLR